MMARDDIFTTFFWEIIIIYNLKKLPYVFPFGASTSGTEKATMTCEFVGVDTF